MAEILRVGHWQVDVAEGWLARKSLLRQTRIRPDARLMAVLSVLLKKNGELVSVDELLSAAWPDRVVSRDSVSTAIYELRRLLGDDAAAPEYIRTEARRGYRLIAAVKSAERQRPLAAVVGYFALICLLIGAGSWIAVTASTDRRPYLHVARIADTTADAQLRLISEAIDATLESALIARHPDRVVARNPSSARHLTLETQLVACDLGPALVVKLSSPVAGLYLWSKVYPLQHDALDATLVERVADEVTLALSRR